MRWKWTLILTGLLYLFIMARCHLVSFPFRKADKELVVKTTGYCACKACCGWEYNIIGMPVYASGPLKGKFKIVGQTASGKMARPGTVAVDPDVFPFGTRFYIPGYGWGIAQDIGSKVKGNHLDLFFWTHHRSGEWGVQNLTVKVWYP